MIVPFISAVPCFLYTPRPSFPTFIEPLEWRVRFKGLSEKIPKLLLPVSIVPWWFTFAYLVYIPILGSFLSEEFPIVIFPVLVMSILLAPYWEFFPKLWIAIDLSPSNVMFLALLTLESV